MGRARGAALADSLYKKNGIEIWEKMQSSVHYFNLITAVVDEGGTKERRTF